VGRLNILSGNIDLKLIIYLDTIGILERETGVRVTVAEEERKNSKF